jgi:uncharacterized protein (TIGR02172 family)
MTPSLGQRLAEGASAEVYAWEPGWILKLFRDWAPATLVDYEAEVTCAVYASGIPVPAVGDIIEAHGRRGILYERVDGPSLLQNFTTTPWKVSHLARTFADLHVELHTHQGSSALPSQREQFRHNIRNVKKISDDVKQALLQRLDTLPDGDRVCHNDFHPHNILMTAQGSVIIDWIGAARGNPHADVVRTSLLLQIGHLPYAGRSVRWLIRVGRRQFRTKYLRRYCGRTQIDPRDLARWEPVVAATRLSENPPGEEEHLHRMINAGLSESS